VSSFTSVEHVNCTRALLLTDMVDSTQLNSTLGDAAMSAFWRAHDSAARELMDAWRGQEVARSDGFLILFEHAGEAAGFAVAYHAALRVIEPRAKARVGVHFGEVSLRANVEADRARGAPLFEVDGVALPLAARVMAAAGPGQTLMTSAAVQSMGPTSLRLRTHGFWRLKGLSEPIELFEIGDSAAPFKPPDDSAKAYRVVAAEDRWLPVKSIPNNLPAERDLFVGRDDELRSLATLMDSQARLATVLGVGGIGKTRLALRYARTWLGSYPGGVWFCDLTTASGLDGIVHSVSQGLDVPLGKTDPVQQIGTALAGRSACLVILDNFEQVTVHAEATIGVWLEKARDAKFIVTSREVLGIVGEHTLVVPQLSADDSVHLFIERAAAVSNDAGLHADGDGAIHRLVRLLEGLPLAIELAAARSSVMSPRLLLERMNERFTLLTSRGGRLGRQATLRATLDWSWELLSSAERSTLAQLSVFEGGFTLSAVEAIVTVPSASQQWAMVDLLQSLVDKSLVRRVDDVRFDLLVTVKEYAAQRLDATAEAESSQEARTDTERRHCAYYTKYGLLEQGARAASEIDNLVAACRHATARGDFDQATEVLQTAWAGLKVKGPFSTAIELASDIQSHDALTNHSSASLKLVAGSALNALGKIESAEKHLLDGLSHALCADDVLLVAELRSALGDNRATAGQMDVAADYYLDALAAARRFENAELESNVLNGLGALYKSLGKLDSAHEQFTAALRVARRANNRRWEAGSLGNLAEVQAIAGHCHEAERLYDEAIAVARLLGDRRWEGNALCNAGINCHALGKYGEARTKLDGALAIARDIGQRRLEAITLCNIGIVAEALGSHDDARIHFQQAINVARELGDRRSEGQFLIYLGVLTSRQQDHRRALDALSRAEQLLAAVSDRLSLGICYSCQVEAALAAGEAAKSKEALGKAELLANELRPENESEFGLALANARRLAG